MKKWVTLGQLDSLGASTKNVRMSGGRVRWHAVFVERRDKSLRLRIQYSPERQTLVALPGYKVRPRAT